MVKYNSLHGDQDICHLGKDEVIAELVNNSEGILHDSTIKQLLEYLEDQTIHSVLQITFEELFIAIWNIYHLLDKENGKEKLLPVILERLNQEMADSDCKCFTGRITRLVNTLSGFTPLVNIQIADNEQIAIIIQIAKTQLENEKRYNV